VLPSELGNLSNLGILNLGSNELSELPPEIGNLRNLYLLALGDNMLVLSQMMNAIDGLPWFFSVAVLGLALLGRLPGTRRSTPPPTSS